MSPSLSGPYLDSFHGPSFVSMPSISHNKHTPISFAEEYVSLSFVFVFWLAILSFCPLRCTSYVSLLMYFHATFMARSMAISKGRASLSFPLNCTVIYKFRDRGSCDLYMSPCFHNMIPIITKFE